MRYLHIMHNEKFIKSYIEFINTNFREEEHNFLIIDGKDNFEIPNFKNIKYVKTSKIKNKFFKIFKVILLFKILREEIKSTDRVYFHSLFDKRLILFLFIFRKYLKKSNWIIWGGDLYNYEERKKFSQYKMWYYIEDYVKKNIAYVNTLVPDDYKIAQKYYGIKGKYKKAQYILKNDFKFLNQLESKLKKEIYIQVGNSATESNNHFEILNMLSKFKNENILIFCILSYGDKEYGKKVEKYGKKIFGNKFIGIFDFLPIKEYYRYLKDIDILIFNQKRQQGLGNIFMLSYFNKKIYLRNDISSWNYLVEDIGIEVNSYLDIEKQNFKEFILKNKKDNKKIIKETVYSNDYVTRIWKDNFNI